MLFNCFSCGRVISNKKDMCPYCRTDITVFQKEAGEMKLYLKKLPEKYKGTLFEQLLHP